MAGKVVDVTLRLNDKMSSPLKSVSSKLKDSADQWKRAGRQIQTVGNDITKVGKGMTAAVTTPIVAMGTAAVVNFGEVDKSLKLVKSTMGDAKWASADLEGAVKKAASSSVFSMQETADAALNFARQGFNAKESADMLTPALSLAAGTATDLSEVTSGLGNALKVFSAQGLTAEDAANVLAKAQAQANTTTSELFESMRVGSSIFNTVGWSMQDLAAVTDVFGDNSISGSEGANAMKTGLAKLVAPAKDGAAWIERLKLNITNADGTMKSMVDVQNQLHGAFSKLTQEEQMQAASAIFGKNQMGKWLTLINTAPETVQKYRNALDDATGTANDMADSLMSGVGGSIEKLKSTFDVLKYSIGSVIGDTVKNAIDRVTGLMDAFNNMDPAMQKTIVKVAAVAAAIGPAIMIFGKMTHGVGTVITKIGALGSNLKKFGSLVGIVTQPAGIVVAVLAAIVVAGVLVYKNWDKIHATAKKVFGYVSKVLKACGLSGDDTKKKLAPLGNTFKSIGKHAKELWTVVSPVFNAIGQLAGTVFKGIFGAAIGGAIGYIGSFLTSITNAASGILNVFDGIIQFVTGVFTGNWKKAWGGIKDIFGGAFKALVSLTKMPLNGVIGIINGAIAGINKLGIKVPDWVPVIGGKGFSIDIPTIPQLYKGTKNWGGGLVQVHERGGEIMDLPRGTRVYPHDESVQRAYRDGMARGKASVIIQKIADTVVIREEADLDKLVDRLARRLEQEGMNIGGDLDGHLPELA